MSSRYRSSSIRHSKRVLFRRFPEMVDNHFVQYSVYHMSAESVDCCITLGTEIVLCSAFLNAGTVDNTEVLEIRGRKSKCDATRLLAGWYRYVIEVT